MDSQKSMLHKDITYYFKYREFSGIFTVNDHISDNSIQINIKFTFTVCEYVIAHEYMLLFNFICNIYIYIYKLCFLFVPTLSHNLFQLVLLDHCH